MRSTLLVILFTLSLSIVGQVQVKGPWTIQCGASSNIAFTQSSGINLRYISPRFKWSEEWNEDEETEPDKYRNMRLMIELIYRRPLKVIYTSFNAQYRLIKYKRLTININGGLKFIVVSQPDHVTTSNQGGRSNAGWYMNMAIQSQLDLGRISPFVEMGGDRILTLGTEIKFQKIYKKPKGRYNLHPKTT